MDKLVTLEELAKIQGVFRPLRVTAAMLQQDGFDVTGVVLPLGLRPKALDDVPAGPLNPSMVMGLPIIWGARPGVVVSPY